MISIGEGWEDLAAALRESDTGERVYVVGATDSGKTTLCRYLVDTAAEQTRTAYVDCDTGQSRIGPPTTEGMAVYPGPSEPYLRFVGSTSPGGHFVQTITGAKRLVEKADELSARVTVIDSPGLVSGGVGIEFQLQMIDLLRPTRIVALQRAREIERLLANFARRPGTLIHRLAVSPAVVARPAAGRRRYREERFRAYFADARSQEIPLRGLGLQGRVPDLGNPRGFGGRLVSLNDPENFVVALGIVEDLHPGRQLEVFAPPFDPAAVASIRFGSISLDPGAAPGSMESFRC
ncbi:Pre-mRNA cleavage and polyadenylation factor IA/II complex, subunit CLP1 [Methanoculleus chikugoensis]|uniref:polynucleotide 5'-hydroxyl-kinase n=1 Tax=Methanoculleus chikugoensis TaxID=118126 RepID=A0A1M4ML92_9EURY|nr:polynucleotide 5'-hydroxyl-kinase [Methanoculleus chikugoensis]MDD4566369.1 polynucleotide 5'-hydroxyl-kinase [Methanoculleus chikugoensis]NMA09494.1 AAA family ATPase [Methanomicrobiales archaeon]SCL75602.1 Pre-mRNA cleavage and polyadenylation factor IA/II complex, subunit CLP1 [Methanoculleus chikugoensis]